jgi:hypothetical protein
MLAADWLRLSCQVDGFGRGAGGEGRGQARITHISLSLSPILSDDILDSIKPVLKFEGALL